jgi:hypothetical protein
LSQASWDPRKALARVSKVSVITQALLHRITQLKRRHLDEAGECCAHFSAA